MISIDGVHDARGPLSRIALSDGAESTIFDGLPASASGVL
jgi:hypothetical protein